MDGMVKATVTDMLNDNKVYGVDLNLFLQFMVIPEKGDKAFQKEDNNIWVYINTNQNSTCFIDKLRSFVKSVPDADYMYYFNNQDCLLSKIIKERQFEVAHSIIKEKQNYHKNLISDKNSNNNNLLHVLLKSINFSDDFLDVLNLMSDLIRISEKKEEFILQKDENGKMFIDYFIAHMKNYYQDYEQIQVAGYNLSSQIFSSSKEVFGETDIDYIKELWPYFQGYVGVNEDTYKLKDVFLEIKASQEKRKITELVNKDHIEKNQVKKRI